MHTHDNICQTHELTYVTGHANTRSHLWKFATWRFVCRGLTVIKTLGSYCQDFGRCLRESGSSPGACGKEAILRMYGEGKAGRRESGSPGSRPLVPICPDPHEGWEWWRQGVVLDSVLSTHWVLSSGFLTCRGKGRKGQDVRAPSSQSYKRNRL